MALKQIEEELPASLIRLGFMIALACMAIFFFISWLLEYKDTIDGRIVITTPTLPIDIHSKVAGNLRLLQDNNTSVKKGTHLAYIENTAQLESGLSLCSCLNSIDPLTTQNPACLLAFQNAALGDLQPTFLNLSRSYSDYSFFLKNDRHQTFIQQKKEQIQLHEDHAKLSNEKIQLHQQNLVQAEKQLQVDQQLYKEEVIAKRTLDQAEQAYAALKYNGRLIDFQTAINTAQIQIAQQEEAILELRTNFIKEKEQLESNIKDAYQALKKELTDWEENYLIVADMDGQVIYSEALTDFNYIAKGSKVITLIPEGKQEITGLLRVPFTGYSKVQKGQPVQVRLDNYPFQEFGILHGEVATLSAIPEADNYAVMIQFPKGLRSTYDIDFEFNQRMEGTASIITNRISVWQRLLNQMKSSRLNN